MIRIIGNHFRSRLLRRVFFSSAKQKAKNPTAFDGLVEKQRQFLHALIKEQLIFDLQKIYSNQNGSFGPIKEDKGLKKSSHNYKRKKNRKEPELFRKNYLQIKLMNQESIIIP